ncbi:MAG: SET domain-containing protein [Candidatus Peribacteraceae bacterium]|jgi:hypothetical protein
MHPNLEVRKTIIGNGVFSNRNISKEEILVIFGGYIFKCIEEASFPKSMKDFSHQITSEFVIGIKKKSELQPVDFINHSCSPNSGFKGQIVLVAMRDIEKDEEITFDYCTVLSRSKGETHSYSFVCQCGSSSCRKVITCNDWKNPNLQKKYSGYFQWYLEEKIKKMSSK